MRSKSTAIRFASTVLSGLFLPSSLQLEVTSKCNLRCKTCLRPDEPNSDMPLKLFGSIIDQYQGPRCKSVILQGLGEPLLNSNLPMMVRYAKKKRLNVGFVSNLTLMNQAIAYDLINCRLDWLAVSFDGASKQTFEGIRRGADFDKICDNVSTLTKAKKELNSRKPRIALSVTLSEYNVEEIPAIGRIAGCLGADSISITPQLQAYTEDTVVNHLQSMPHQDLARKIGIDQSFLRKEWPCKAISGCYVTYDGKVMPCSMLIEAIPRDQYERVQLGDLTTQSLSDVWFSRTHRNVRFDRMRGRFSDYCRYCPAKINEERERKGNN